MLRMTSVVVWLAVPVVFFVVGTLWSLQRQRRERAPRVVDEREAQRLRRMGEAVSRAQSSGKG